MTNALIAAGAIILILLLSEYLWRNTKLKGEFARKFVHVVAGSFIAFLPFWVSYGWIALLGAGFVFLLVANRYTTFLNAIHTVKRKTWGDLLAGIAGIICALARPNKWLFTGAILQVALADGMAAIIGSHYAKRRYKIFNHVKSPLGSLTFFLFSLSILLLLMLSGDLTSTNWLLALLAVPLSLTLLESISGYGFDNISLPLGFLVLLRLLNVS